MGFLDAIKIGFRKYANAAGRASRSAYWYFFLFVVVVHIGLRVIHPMLAYAFDLAVFLPNIAVAMRRLHDIDRDGRWLWLGFIPVVGWLVLIVWFCKRGDEGENRFGAPPLQAEAMMEAT